MQHPPANRVERTLLSAAFDVAFAFDFFAGAGKIFYVERTLLSAAFDVAFDFDFLRARERSSM